jgi:hypothetical protein
VRTKEVMLVQPSHKLRAWYRRYHTGADVLRSFVLRDWWREGHAAACDSAAPLSILHPMSPDTEYMHT